MKLIKFFQWLAFHSAYGLALYFGLVRGVEGAANVAAFYAWLVFAFAWLALLLATKVAATKIGPSAAPTWINRPVGMAWSLTWIWFGWPCTGIALFFGTSVLGHLRDREAKADKPTAEPSGT